MPPAPASKAMTRDQRRRLLKPSPAVLALPQMAERFQKVWCNPIIGEVFSKHKGPKGSKHNNGCSFIIKTFIDEFCPAVHPQLTKEDAADYKLIIGNTIYTYVSNHTQDGTPGITLKKPRREKSKTYAYVAWKRENPEQFKTLLDQYLDDHPEVDRDMDVGTRKRVSCELFKAHVSKEDRARYKREAQETFKRIKELQGLVGDARAQYIQDFPKRLKGLMEEAEKCAGIKLNVQMFAEKEDGNFSLSTIASNTLKDFCTSSAMSHLLSSLKQWLQEKSGKVVDSGVPSPAPYPSPDPKGHREPLLPPNWADLQLADQQKLWRQFATLKWRSQGSVKQVPWEEILKDPSKWIDPKRLPEGFEWKDPGSMIQQQLILILLHVRDGDAGLLGDDQKFQYRRTIASQGMVDATNSQESSRELVTRKGKEVYEILFDATITQCHVIGGLEYPKESLDYAEFMASEVANSTEDVANPAEWLGLPTGASAESAEPFKAEETAALTNTISQFDELIREDLSALVESYLKFHVLLPASTSEGIWSAKNNFPALFPLALPNDPSSNFFRDFWLPITYYSGPRKCLPNGTFLSFEAWIEDLLEAKQLIHEQSGTLLGGPTGCIWIVCALLKLFFNFSAVLKDIDPPVAILTEYDASRLPVGDLPRLTKWVKDWTTLLDHSSEILVKSYSACSVGVPHSRTSRSPSAASMLAPTPEPEDDETPATKPRTPKSSRRSKRTTKGKKSSKNSRTKFADILDDEELAQSSSDKDSSSEGEDFEHRDDSGDDGLSDEERRSVDDAEHIAPLQPLTAPEKKSAGKASLDFKLGLGGGLEYKDFLPPHCEHIEIEDFVFDGVHIRPSPPPPVATIPTRRYYTRFNVPPSTSPRDARLEDLRLAHTLVARTPDYDPHKTELLAQAMISWVRAKHNSPAIFRCAQRVFEAARESVALVLMGDAIGRQIFKTGNRLEHDIAALVKAQQSLRVVLAKLRWTWDEFVLFGKLSTGYWRWLEQEAQWESAIHNWIVDLEPPPVDVFVKSFEGVCIWVGIAERCTRLLIENRRQVWSITQLPWDEQNTILGPAYRFGALSLRDMHSSDYRGVRHLLNEALQSARDKYDLIETMHRDLDEGSTIGLGPDKWRLATASVGAITADTMISHPLFRRPARAAQSPTAVAPTATSVEVTPAVLTNTSVVIETAHAVAETASASVEASSPAGSPIPPVLLPLSELSPSAEPSPVDKPDNTAKSATKTAVSASTSDKDGTNIMDQQLDAANKEGSGSARDLKRSTRVKPSTARPAAVPNPDPNPASPKSSDDPRPPRVSRSVTKLKSTTAPTVPANTGRTRAQKVAEEAATTSRRASKRLSESTGNAGATKRRKRGN
ncbi:hypothetical protein RhiJN_22631 [Ceratobasidium sp. AG-Ba]|nr:hypothetical protein RhiJN_22631 [Ceratobasidium sp. AG-Ba]